MKPRLASRPEAGLTLFEVGVVVAVVMILAAVLLPHLSLHHRARKLGCVNNLKQVGLAYRIWAGDNGDMYPMGLSVTNGGSKEMVVTGNVLQTFLAMSNEISTPIVLFCPEDSARLRARTFYGLANSNISYFINVDVTNEADPQAILSGDDNFELGGSPMSPGLLSLSTNAPVAWTSNRHKRSGYLLFGDGSVQLATPSELHKFLVESGTATNRLAIP